MQERILLSLSVGDPAVRLGLSPTLVGYYFPRLYPEGIELKAGAAFDGAMISLSWICLALGSLALIRSDDGVVFEFHRADAAGRRGLRGELRFQ